MKRRYLPGSSSIVLLTCWMAVWLAVPALSGEEPSDKSAAVPSEATVAPDKDSASEKSALEKPTDSQPAENAGTKPPAEKASGEKASGEKASGEKASGEKASGEKASGEKATGEKPAGEKSAEDASLPAGHSTHGEAFNEGPRQRAYLMHDTGYVHFPVTTQVQQVKAFFNQGVGLLHGFWYFEAERSFRQVALLDPDCAMEYWGMAMANTNNAKRAKGFIAEAVKRKDKASDRERLFIEALDAYHRADAGKKKPRAEAYTKALERILLKYPHDVEAKAFLALQLYLNRDAEMPIVSYLAVDALLEQIFAVNPLHPAHHYRIHLWDYEKPDLALRSAATCGQAAAGIAHMWHMPGHIYSRLKRYDDACWQQEASARVDHAHMMRDRVLPDQIHNFAHNNEWLIRNLIFVGRSRDALSLAKNMLELPRHPKYNTLERGSFKFGRLRLFQVLTRFEMWDELIALAETPYLEPTENETEQVKRLRHLGVAQVRRGQLDAGRAQLTVLQERQRTKQEAREKAGQEAERKAQDAAVPGDEQKEKLAAAERKTREAGGDDSAVQTAREEAEKAFRSERLKAKERDIAKAGDDARKAFDAPLRALEKAIQEIEGHLAVAASDFRHGHELLKKAGDVEASYLAWVQLQAGDKEPALKAMRNFVAGHKNEVLPLAAQVELCWRAGEREEARRAFDQLRDISGSLDATAPPLARLAPIAQELNLPTPWQKPLVAANDVGVRPTLDSLGPFRWQAPSAPPWQLTDSSGQPRSLRDYVGRPVVVIFYLGHACLHCAEQLQKFAPVRDEFAKAGIELVAISTDDREGLNMAIGNYENGKFPIPLCSDAGLESFRAYRCYDDFEQQPLHGTFVVDGAGRVRWQDIGYEPFMDAKFVLQEAQRILSHDVSSGGGSGPLAGTPAAP
ncbi:MAG: redoxin domain-containing protein [Pirellulaceae bacterium]